MPLLVILLLTPIILIALAEIVLRLAFGLGNPLLYIPDPEIGYLIAPNQKTRRQGNSIQINQYSMRNKPINNHRPDETLRILLIGDSIANGGWWTDQDYTISALLEQQLTGIYPNFSAVEVLNASANSWGPRHELAYLKKFGTFQSQVIILLLNTDDFFSLAPRSLVVGNDRNYPDRKPILACQEIWQKFTPARPTPPPKKSSQEKGDIVGFNLEAMGQIKAIAREANAQFLLALTPLKREIIPPGSRDYEQKARQRLQQIISNQNIIYVDLLPIFKQQEEPENLYQDHIHLNHQGTKLVSEILAQKLARLRIDN